MPVLPLASWSLTWDVFKSLNQYKAQKETAGWSLTWDVFKLWQYTDSEYVPGSWSLTWDVLNHKDIRDKRDC